MRKCRGGSSDGQIWANNVFSVGKIKRKENIEMLVKYELKQGTVEAEISRAQVLEYVASEISFWSGMITPDKFSKEQIELVKTAIMTGLEKLGGDEEEICKAIGVDIDEMRWELAKDVLSEEDFDNLDE